jgi:hypothetical protein
MAPSPLCAALSRPDRPHPLFHAPRMHAPDRANSSSEQAFAHAPMARSAARGPGQAEAHRSVRRVQRAQRRRTRERILVTRAIFGPSCGEDASPKQRRAAFTFTLPLRVCLQLCLGAGYTATYPETSSASLSHGALRAEQKHGQPRHRRTSPAPSSGISSLSTVSSPGAASGTAWHHIGITLACTRKQHAAGTRSIMTIRSRDHRRSEEPSVHCTQENRECNKNARASPFPACP